LNDTAADWPPVPYKADGRHPTCAMHQRVELSPGVVMISRFSPFLGLTNCQNSFHVFGTEMTLKK
jgi:hypothetical protein